MSKKIKLLTKPSAENSQNNSTTEIKFREFVENLPVMFYVVEPFPPFKPLYISPAFKTLGYPLEDWYENPDAWINAIHDDDRERILTETAEAIREGGGTDYEYRIVGKNGEIYWVRDRSCCVCDESGKVVRWQGLIMDITDRKIAKQDLERREELYRTFTRNIPNTAVLLFDRDLRYTLAEGLQLPKHGYVREMFEGKTIFEVFPPEIYEEWAEYYHRALKGETVHFERKTGEGFFEIFVVPVKNDKGEIFAGMVMWHDITANKEAEIALKESESRYRLLGEGIMHQVWTAQPDGKLDYVNGKTLEYFGCPAEQLLEDSWKDVLHPNDLPECLERWSYSLRTGEYYETEFRLLRQDGEYRWHLARATAGRDAEGNIVKWFGTNTDIHNQKLAEARLNHYACHDTLTSLPNRVEFMNQLKQTIERAAGNNWSRFAVLFLDLDRFKIINDSLGHDIGDRLLIAIAERLKSCVRPGDIVARLGGDEFTILLNRTGDIGDVVGVADRMQKRLSEPFKLGNYEVFTSASIGVIISDGERRQPEDYLRDADAAMYRAKESGKARYEIFDREMHVRNMNLLQIETDLRHALERHEFEVNYQPIISLETGEVNEFEALLRWRHPEHGLVAPNEFISVAEETGLIIPIGKWILEEACRQTAEWQRRFPARESLSISVNLSAKQLMHPNLMAQVHEVLLTTNLQPDCLQLEVTESTVMEHHELAEEVLNELHKIGVYLSTDDFGTGYSSLSYLHRFPFDRLKIDRSFINRMDSNSKCLAIVRTLLLLGQNLNLEIVAEGIETENQLRQLQNLGCGFGQGYLFSKPVSQIEAEKLLRDGIKNFTSDASFVFGGNRELIELSDVQ